MAIVAPLKALVALHAHRQVRRTVARCAPSKSLKWSRTRPGLTLTYSYSTVRVGELGESRTHAHVASEVVEHSGPPSGRVGWKQVYIFILKKSILPTNYLWTFLRRETFIFRHEPHFGQYSVHERFIKGRYCVQMTHNLHTRRCIRTLSGRQLVY